jgi:hypothetical protein
MKYGEFIACTPDGYIKQDTNNQKKHNINHLIKANNFTKYLEIGVDDPSGNFDKIICKHKHSVDPCIEFDTDDVTYKKTSDEFFDLLDNNKLDLPKDYKWDVIFIDGLHQANQVERDFDNAFKHLSDNGFILMHDTNPPTLWHAREDYKLPNGWLGPWNGTVWKCIYKLNATRKDLVIHTIGSAVRILKRTFGNDFDEKFTKHNGDFPELQKEVICSDNDGNSSTLKEAEIDFDNDTCWGLSIISRGIQECCDFDNSFYEYREFQKNRIRHLNIISPDEFYKIYK